jgi:hypothetical protein
MVSEIFSLNVYHPLMQGKVWHRALRRKIPVSSKNYTSCINLVNKLSVSVTNANLIFRWHLYRYNVTRLAGTTIIAERCHVPSWQNRTVQKKGSQIGQATCSLHRYNLTLIDTLLTLHLFTFVASLSLYCFTVKFSAVLYLAENTNTDSLQWQLSRTTLSDDCLPITTLLKRCHIGP